MLFGPRPNRRVVEERIGEHAHGPWFAGVRAQVAGELVQVLSIDSARIGELLVLRVDDAVGVSRVSDDEIGEEPSESGSLFHGALEERAPLP